MALGNHAEWSRLVRHRIEDLAMGLVELGRKMAEIEGRTSPYSQPTVSRWLAEAAPSPSQVFAMEAALDMPAGSLSTSLGYVPVSHDGGSPQTIQQILEADPRLASRDRRALLALYDTLVE